MSIELIGGYETLIFKKIDDLYDSSSLIENIGNNVNDFKFSLWENAINSVKIGYPEKSYSYTNDILEVNGESIYNIGNRIYNKQLDLQSKYRADGSGMTEIELGSSNDSDIFIVCIDDYTTHYAASLNYHRRISNNSTILQQYNTRITPMRCMEINKNLICSLTYGVEYDRYYLMTPTIDRDKESQKNILDTETSFDGGMTYLKEKEGLLLTSGTKIFKPFVFSFTGQISETFIDNYIANKNGYVEFTFRGTTYKGFILYAKTKFTGKSNCELKLLSTPDNDLTLLIR
jgi:hypothetical protein